MLRVVRAWRSFGMILNRDDRKHLVAHAFDATVVKVYMGDFNFRRQTVSKDCKAVIVRSDLNVTVLKIFHRLIATTMTEDKLESLAAKRATQQLMTETDAKCRHA